MICNYIETCIAEGVYTDRKIQADLTVIILRHMLDVFIPEVSKVVSDMMLGYCSVCACGNPSMAVLMIHKILKDNPKEIKSAIENSRVISNKALKAVKTHSSSEHPIRMNRRVCEKYDKKWEEQKNPDGSFKIDETWYWRQIIDNI